MQTKQVELNDILKSMLIENTGAHFLDSGGVYGYNYDRNKARDFDSEPACTVDAHDYGNGEVEVITSYSVYHYLKNFLDIDETSEQLMTEFNALAEADENSDLTWTELLEKMAEGKWFNLYTTNTYNYDNILSQTLLYTTFTLDDANFGDTYIALQIHGGCDVRGGYTKPYIFKVADFDYFLMAQNDVSVHAGNGQSWYSDDGGIHYYPSNDEAELNMVIVDDMVYALLDEPVDESKDVTLFDRNEYGVTPAQQVKRKLTFNVMECW